MGVFIVHPDIRFPAFTSSSTVAAHHQRQALPIPVCDHRLRRHLRFPFASLFRYHAEDAGQRNDARAIGYGAMLCESWWVCWR